MEARIGGESHRFYSPVVPHFLLKEGESMGSGKKSMEWDLNDWKWDGNLFVASPLNSSPPDCRNKQFLPAGSQIPASAGLSNSSSSCSDKIDVEGGRGKGELEKRRRVVMVKEDGLNDEAGSLTLNLGGHVYPVTEAEIANLEGKKNHLQGLNASRSVCQVEGCRADLSNSRDYHRRHKVCEMHSKATKALVGNVMQRFCQQCSRFHSLQEFDEGKRSCRRRLAGHNRRRRKTHPDAVVGGSSLNDDRAGSYLLITILKILSNLHSNTSDQAKDQGLLSHFLRNLASIAGTSDGGNLSGLLQASQDLQKNGTSIGTSSEVVPAFLPNGTTCVSAQGSARPLCLPSDGIRCADAQDQLERPVNQSQSVTVAAVGQAQKGIAVGNLLGEAVRAIPTTEPTNIFSRKDNLPFKAKVSSSLRHKWPPESTEERAKRNNIDLNDIYIDSQDCTEESERTESHAKGAGSRYIPSWVPQDSHQSSPPQTSGNSDSPSAQSLTSSNGDAQNRTDRIVFKLFGKNPSDFPLVLRAQILDWLSHSPTDIESYIRPGCIILTIYLCLAESAWEELSCKLGSSLHGLLNASNDDFWSKGWVHARVRHRMAFIYDGIYYSRPEDLRRILGLSFYSSQVVLDASLPPQCHNHCRISWVTPIAVSVSGRANFTVKGFNLCRSSTRLLCAFEGMYLAPETSHPSLEDNGISKENNEIQCVSFSCSLPGVTGRGFIEVEDHGLSSGFFPFIVAEQDMCSEIRTLERAIELNKCDVSGHKRTDVMEARNQALDFLHEMGWLLRRSHLWSRSNHMDAPLDSFPLKRFKWLMEFSMDHDWCAVVKKLLDVLFDGAVDACGHSSVELALSEMGLLHRAVRRNCRPMVELLLRYVPVGRQNEQGVGKGSDGGFLFSPDMVGPAGVTPLHIAASRDDTENMLDALTDDPGLVGIEAWKSARDSSGFAPEDYARLRGYYSYIHLVCKKISNKAGHVILDISSNAQKQTDSPDFGKLTRFQIDKHEVGPIRPHCKICDQRVLYRNTYWSLPYRPLMLSMVAIAAVCVCMGLLFHGPPDILYVFGPFRWELLDYGPI